MGIDSGISKSEVSRVCAGLDEDGRPVVRDDGKVAKGARFRAPDVAAVLRAQGWAG